MPPVEFVAGLNSRFSSNASVIAPSALLASVPAEHRLIEGIAYDSRRGRLFVGSIMDRRLLVREGSGWRALSIPGLGGVFGMAIDQPRRLLWLASGPAEPMTDAASAFAGLIAIDLDRLTEVRRIAIPGARLGDTAVAADGTLFASDSTSGAVYRCRPGCRTPEILVSPGRLRSPQGMVVWPGGHRLYLADYTHGLFRVDLPSGRLSRVLPPQPEMMESIDGLLRHGNRLIAIQNGTSPRRILAFTLDRAGQAIARMDVLERANPDWGEPTLGALDGDRLVYVADSQWERYGPNGAMRGEGPLRPTAIRSLPLR
jgi:sugar lactone lactonase YvrE